MVDFDVAASRDANVELTHDIWHAGLQAGIQNLVGSKLTNMPGQYVNRYLPVCKTEHDTCQLPGSIRQHVVHFPYIAGQDRNTAHQALYQYQREALSLEARRK